MLLLKLKKRREAVAAAGADGIRWFSYFNFAENNFVA